MKKISVTTWLILGGIFLYTASLWQRPLFISEFSCGNTAIEALCSGKTVPACEMPFFIIFKYLGMTPFSFRIFPALLTLLCAGVLFLTGRRSTFPRISQAGALIFLLTPAVFLCGTTGLSYIYRGAPVVISFYLLLLMSQSSGWSRIVSAGAGAAAALLLSLYLPGTPTHFFVTLAGWIIYRVLDLLFNSPEEKKKKIPAVIYSFIPFIPAFIFVSFHGTVFQLPQLSDVRTLAAAAVAGSFPWVIFLPAVLKNFSRRVKLAAHDPFTLGSCVLCIISLAAALFTPASAAFFIPFLAGAGVLLAAGLIMEQEENGLHSANVCLYILTGVFFLAAAGIALYSALGIYTQLLKPVWKLFSPRDSWVLSAIVPAVTAIWCLTGAGEKVSKERKFLALCAGTAFMLLAFHGLVPLKAIEYNAPVNFLQKVVRVRTGDKIIFYGDAKMFTPLQTLFKNSDVRRISSDYSAAELKKAQKERKKICVVTLSRALSDKLPFPKTTLRSGSFTAVFYNIDFPEMRVRKP